MDPRIPAKRNDAPLFRIWIRIVRQNFVNIYIYSMHLSTFHPYSEAPKGRYAGECGRLPAEHQESGTQLLRCTGSSASLHASLRLGQH